MPRSNLRHFAMLSCRDSYARKLRMGWTHPSTRVLTFLPRPQTTKIRTMMTTSLSRTPDSPPRPEHLPRVRNPSKFPPQSVIGLRMMTTTVASSTLLTPLLCHMVTHFRRAQLIRLARANFRMGDRAGSLTRVSTLT